MFNETQNRLYIERLNHFLVAKFIEVTFYLDSIEVPPVERRFKLIMEVHAGTLSRHRGYTKTLENEEWSVTSSEIVHRMSGGKILKTKNKNKYDHNWYPNKGIWCGFYENY